MDKKQFKDLYRKSIKLETVYCCLCGKPIEKEKELSIDHLMPRSRGGVDEIGNWGISHKVCNQQKGALTLEEYRWWLDLERKRNGQKLR